MGEPLIFDPTGDFEDFIRRVRRGIDRWNVGERVSAESLLGHWAGAPTLEEIFELVYLEFLIREQAGERPLDDLAGRFPVLADRLRRRSRSTGRSTAPTPIPASPRLTHRRRSPDRRRPRRDTGRPRWVTRLSGCSAGGGWA